MTVLALCQQLHQQGVILMPSPNGTVHCRAPKGVLTPALVDAMRQDKSELHGLVEAWRERAAIAEHCGGLSRPEAERLAWQWVLGATPEQTFAASVPVYRGDDSETTEKEESIHGAA
jgi:tubulysin polyketide synthase-like protein